MAYPRFRLSRAHKFQRSTGGNITLASATFADLDGSAMDLSLPARVGDTIEVVIAAIVGAPTVTGTVVLDVASIVGGAAANYWASGGAGTDYSPWYRDGADTGNSPVNGTLHRAVVSGDLSAGVLTLRPRGRIDGGGSVTVWRSAVVPFFFAVKNLGPAAA